MGSTTTFSALKEQPVSKKVFLVEIKAGEHVTGWELDSGYSNTYSVGYLYETITKADKVSTEDILKLAVSVAEDGTDLTERASVAQVEANSGSWYHDTANEVLYLHTTGSDVPSGYTIVVSFWLLFGTEGIKLNNYHYEDYIQERGIPSISQSNPNLYWGVSSISSGSVQLSNSDGYFDQISKKFLWLNRELRVLLGGDELAYAEYKRIYTGIINNKRFSERDYIIDVKSAVFSLLRTIPINKFWISNYANLDPAAEGWPIPIYYGDYDVNQAPVVTCVNTAYGANQYQFLVADHAIKSITQVYIDYQDGSGWQTISHSNEDLSGATFVITSASFQVGITQVKVAFEGKHSGGTLIEGAPEIVEDLLTDVMSIDSSNLNSTAFTESKSESDMILNVPINNEVSSLTVIEKICQSDLAFFDEDEEGLLRYRTWIPYVGDSIESISDDDIIDRVPEMFEDDTNLYYKVSVGYSYRSSENRYIYQDEEDDTSIYKYGKEDRLKLDTYIRGESDAIVLAQRLLLLVKEPTTTLNITTKIPIVDALIGDKVYATFNRAMNVDGGITDRVLELNSKRIECFPVRTSLSFFDLREFGGNIGYWTDSSAPNWNSSTDADKAVSGYWTDSDGFADPGDASSLNVSKWW